MEDPIDRLRQAFEERQALHRLRQFASKSEADSFERDWKFFVNSVVRPAFERVKHKFPDKAFVLFPDPEQIGFKVLDFPSSEFWFWIELHRRIPEVKAGRGTPGKKGLLKVSTAHLSAKQNFDLTDVTVDDIVSAIADTYTRCPYKG